MAMIAPPGMGKTTLLFHLLHRLHATAKTAFIFQTQCTSNELLRNLLSEFECDTSSTDPVQMFRELKSLLLAEANAGRRCVMIIDEAQNLSSDVLETIRLLSNFETPRRKLLNIVLSGQAELGEVLYSSGMRQLRQRLSCIAYLQQFTPAETALYVAHRLEVAGYPGKVSDLFSVSSLVRIAHFSQGIPRVINNLCFNALSLGYALESKQLDVAIIDEVAADLGLSKSPSPHLWSPSESYAKYPSKPLSQAHEDHAETESEILSAVATRQEKRTVSAADKVPTNSPEVAHLDDHHDRVMRPKIRHAVYGCTEGTTSDIGSIAPFMETERHVVNAAVEVAQPAQQAEIAQKIPDEHRSSKSPFLVRGLACLLVLCVAPVSGIQLSHDADVAAAPEKSVPIAGQEAKNSFTQVHPPAVAATSSPPKTATIPKVYRRIRTRYRPLRKNHKAMPVDLMLATFAPEPLIQAISPRPIPLPSHDLSASSVHSDAVPTQAIPQNAEASQSYIPPRAIWQPAPTYVPITRRRHIARDVQLMLSISSTGDVYKADILKGSGRLALIAERTVERWKYSPALSNGVPVSSQIYVTIQFQRH